MMQEYFAIELSDSVRLALPLEDMETVTRVEHSEICPIPGVAQFWLGVVNQGGSLLWVLDSSRFWHLSSFAYRQGQSVTMVVLKHQVQGTQRRVGLIVRKLEGLVILSNEFITEEKSCHPLLATRVEHNDQPIAILETDPFFQTLYSPTLVTNSIS